jgi:hypothetical protein
METETVVDRLLYPLLRNGEFDPLVFEESYERVFGVLVRDSATWFVLAPLPGATFEGAPIGLGSGAEIIKLSDAEIATCLSAGLLESRGSTGLTYVGDVFAVRLTETWPIVVGDADESPLDDAQAAWDQRAERIETAIHALRLVKPGAVYSTGTVSFSMSFHEGRGYTFGYSPTSRGNSRGDYNLASGEVDDLVRVHASLESAAVRNKPFLATAIRRFAMSEERFHIEDRVLDLMISAEALFTPRTQTEVAHKVALHAAAFLARSGLDPKTVFTTMKDGYAARSKIAHGASIATASPPLDALAATLGGYLREALTKMIDYAEKGIALSDPAAWNDLVVGRLGGPETAGIDLGVDDASRGTD